MNAKELRIGTLVDSQIEGCNKIDFGIVELDSSAMIYLLDVDNDWDRIKPIPLTEEWLLRLGFERTANYMVLQLPTRMRIQFYDGNPAECDICQDSHMISFKCNYIKFVHQLQNLYWCLCGEELILTP